MKQDHSVFNRRSRNRVDGSIHQRDRRFFDHLRESRRELEFR